MNTKCKVKLNKLQEMVSDLLMKVTNQKEINKKEEELKKLKNE